MKTVMMVAKTFETDEEETEATLSDIKDLIEIAKDRGAPDNALYGRAFTGTGFEPSLTVTIRWEIDPQTGKAIEEAKP